MNNCSLCGEPYDPDVDHHVGQCQYDARPALREVRARLEWLRDAEPNDGSSPLYAGLARALGEEVEMSRKLPVGSRCFVTVLPGEDDPGPGTVIRHGRDAGGIYTLIRFDGGREEQYHRDCIRPLTKSADPIDKLCYFLRLYVHAHASGNSIPPHLEQEARDALTSYDRPPKP